MHGSLGAAEQALGGRTFAADEVSDLVVWAPAAGVSLILEPADAKKQPRSEYEGKFSLQYCVASMLVRGHVNVQDFSDEAIADEAVLALARRVRYETREYDTAGKGFPGGFRATLATGETVEGDFPFQKGGPDYPLTDAEVRAKFRANAELALSPATGATE